MLKIGLTGGIGSGKTVISKIFNILGYPVYNSDAKAKKLMYSSPIIKKELIESFGKNIYLPDGFINKESMAKIIFSDPQSLKKVNGIVHPIVLDDYQNWAKSINSTLAIMESAIIFESGFQDIFDKIILVTADLSTRISRVKKRDNCSMGSIHSRVKNQITDNTVMSKCDFVIYNNENDEVLAQVLNTIRDLSK